MNSKRTTLWLPLLWAAGSVGAVFVLDLFARDWLSPLWYLSAALVGLLIGGPIAWGLRPKNYEGERPIREVGTGMGQ